MTKATNLVHEADAQRHHVRVKLPAIVEIDGIAYQTKDWSTAGASVLVSPEQSATDAFKEGKVHNVRLIFDFNGFTLVVPMKVEVRHTRAEDSDSYVGLRYIDMTQEQIVIMQQLVGSYVTGELSSVGEIIHVMSRNNFTKPRQVPKRENLSSRERFSGLLKKAAVPVVSILLLAYVSLAIFEQNFVASAQKAVVTGDSVPVMAPAGGIVSLKDLHGGDRVRKGEVLMTIQGETGTVTGVDSPCDCIVEERLVGSGMTVSKGTSILRLLPLDTPLYVEARVSYKDSVRLLKGQKAVLDIPGSRRDMEGTVVGIFSDAGADASVRVTIRTSEKIPVDLAGLPIRVRINMLGKAGE